MVQSQEKMRRCLKCDSEFLSAHFGLRLCHKCRSAQVVLPPRGRCTHPSLTPRVVTYLECGY